MKYTIPHLLEGIAADRLDKMKRLYQEIEEQTKALGDSREAMEQGVNKAYNLLCAIADEVYTAGTYGRRQYEDAQQRLRQLYIDTPDQRSIDRGHDKLAGTQKQVQQLAGEAEAAGSDLELFLKALLADGETHVTTNGIKEAGFPQHDRLGRYIVARANKAGG